MGSCSSSSKNVVEPTEASTEQNTTVPSAFSQDAPKAFAQKIDNGEKFLEGLLRFLQTRAELEANYVKKLSGGFKIGQ